MSFHRSAPHAGGPTRDGGFTLIELLVVVGLAALLLTGVASSVGVFGEEIRSIRTEPDRRLEEAVLDITELTRDAWSVAVPAADRIEITDAYGRLTVFDHDPATNTLEVVRPSGASGGLLDGVASFDVDVQTVRRYRDLDPTEISGVLATRAQPASPAPVELVLTDGDALALGFMLSSVAPDSAKTVDEIDEELLFATPGQLALELSFLGGDQHEFCHLHASPPHDPNHSGYEGNALFVDVYEARAPDDARPVGASLGQLQVPVGELPATEFVWWDTDEDEGPVDVPGGVAWGWWKNHEEVELLVTPTVVEAEVDLSALSVELEPGRAYTLVLSVKAWDEVRIQAVPVATASASNVALSTGGGDFVSQALTLPLTLNGTQSVTQTEAFDVVSRVTVSLEMDDGRTLGASATVAGQTSVDDPWGGVVPGELETLEL